MEVISLAKPQPDEEALLTLPIRFHVTQRATMTVKVQKMDVWVQPSDLTGPVLEEINRIWKPANIQFTVERAQADPLLQPADFAELLKSIAHELGHNLTLVHPDKSVEFPVGRLMGGRKQGYALTPEEIAKARLSARKHLAD